MRKILAVAALAAAFTATMANAEPEPFVVAADSPLWAQKPGKWELLRELPNHAIMWTHKGGADVKCRIAQGGALEGCALIAQTHKDFGPAALYAAPKFRMKAPADGGLAEGSQVIIPFLYEVYPG